MFGANFIECDKHCGVDDAIDVEESAGDALHAHDAAFIKFWCGRGVGGVLHLGPIRRRKPFVGRVMGACRHRVLEALQGFLERVGHGDVNSISRVVPFDGKPAVLPDRWVDGDGLILLERVKEVGGVVCSEELHTEVIYSEGEGVRQGCVGPNSGGVRHRSLAVRLEVADKAIVGDDTGLL